MRRISTPTASADNQFLDRVSGGRNATQFQASWCNAVQEEIAHVIESTGENLAQDPDAPDNTQLFQAIRTLGFNGYRVASANTGFDFGGRSGNSVVVLTAVSDVLFPNKDNCPKNAIVIVVEPWTASTPGPVTVSQRSGGFIGPILKGEVAICCFDASGVFTSCVRIPSNGVGGFGLFGILDATGPVDLHGNVTIRGLLTSNIIKETAIGSTYEKNVRFNKGVSLVPLSSKQLSSENGLLFYAAETSQDDFDLTASTDSFVVGQTIKIVNTGTGLIKAKYNETSYVFIWPRKYAEFVCIGGSSGRWLWASSYPTQI